MIAFDELWYLRTYPTVSLDIAQGFWPNAQTHYHQCGAKRGYSPSAYFNEGWYRATYPDVAEAVRQGVFRSGFHHYLSAGAREGRNPHEGFDEQTYRAVHPDVLATMRQGKVLCAYEYYLLSGRFLGEGAGPLENAGAATPDYTPVVTDRPSLAPLQVNVLKISPAEARLNVLLPALRMASMSGGPNTALNLIYRFAAATGIPVRLISANTLVDSDTDALWAHLQSLSDIRERLPNVTFASAADPANPAQIGDYDVFLATAWWTAQMASRVLPAMRHKRFFYLIQDFEPAFSPWSTEYCLALETYSMDFLPIFNTAVLRDYFMENKVGVFADAAFHAKSIAFEPALDRRHFYAEAALPGQPHRLLFYARPRIGKRNLFEIGLGALKRAADAGAFSAEWELRYMGEPLPSTQLTRDCWIHGLAWLGFDQYAAIMRQSRILLSPMMSPHPSYPPLEMAYCGQYAVTNTCSTKTAERLQQYSPNIICCEPTIASMAEAVITAAALVEEGFAAARHHSFLPSGWDQSFAPVLPFLANGWREITANASTRLQRI